jgi:hypothetical protein
LKTDCLYTDLFVLILDGNILTPEAFKAHWKSYGSSGLHGWRPPKKVYYKLSHARCGLSHVPQEIKSKVSIHKFSSVGIVASGEEIAEQQEKVRERRETEVKARALRYKKEELASMKRDVEKLEKELADN